MARGSTSGNRASFCRLVGSQAGVSVTGDGTSDLDPFRVYYVGASLGSFYGPGLLAVDPSVRAGVLNTVGGSRIDINRLRPNSRAGLATRTDLAGRGLLSKQLNVPGITKIDGLSATADFFNENMPLRDGLPLTVGLTDGTTQVIQSPVTNTVDGAIAVQQVFDNWDWVSQPGDPVAWAPYLRKDPLPGVPVKPVIIQFAKGDQNISNPTTTAFLRAGNLRDRATYYRCDLAVNADSTLKKLASYPHTFLGVITGSNSTAKAVAFGAQRQVAEFFTSDGQVIDDLADITTSNGTPLFEVPIQRPLPEGLNYIV
jgi:hypothetical protein